MSSSSTNEVGVGGANTSSNTSTSSTASPPSTPTPASPSPAFTSPYYTTYATNTTIAPFSTSTTHPGHSGSSAPGKLPSGTVAGVAVAAAVGGAVLAFILTFMFMRSRSQKWCDAQRHSEKRRSSGGVKALLAKSSDDLLDTKHAWEKHLPQPADDNSIRLTVKTLLHQVELHVENFYTDSAASSNVSEEVHAELLKLGSPFLPKSLAVLLPQARVKTALIKHCLAYLIVSNITTEGTQASTSQSFLPLELVALPHALERARSDPSSKPGMLSLNPPPPKAPYFGPRSSHSASSSTSKTHTATPIAFSQSLSRWRVLTTYLLPAPASDTTYTMARNAVTAAAATTFCTAFAPWAARPQDRTARFQNLVTIMQGAADAGILLFAQPATFSWTWDAVGGGNAAAATREIVVTPGFVKVADDEARKLGRPQVMVQQAVHAF